MAARKAVTNVLSISKIKPTLFMNSASIARSRCCTQKIQCLPSQRHFGLSTINARPAYDAEFEDAKTRLNSLKEDPGNDVKLKIYALFKQSTTGKCNAKKPGMMDFVGKAKWTAWNDLGNMSQDDAQKAYIDIVNGLVAEESGNAAKAAEEAAAAGPGKQYDGMTITRENKVFHIRLNRPKKKNAITWDMYRALGEALEECANDDSYSIAVLTGTGDYYCSGNDLSNFTNVTPEQIPAMAKEGREVLRVFVNSFINFPKPLISLVNGPAVGISVTILGLFDAVYCTDKATFATPFSALGQSPEGCSSYIFPKIMGPAKANEMLLFNRKITAEQALERNLVSQVIPDKDFHEVTSKIIDQYAKFPPQSMKLSKVLNRSAEKDLLVKVNEAECELLEERWQSKECINAIMAFFSRSR